MEAREQMLLGSSTRAWGSPRRDGGAFSVPLGGRYGIPHGMANTLLLPAVMAYNLPAALEKFTIIAEAMGRFPTTCPCARPRAWRSRRWRP